MNTEKELYNSKLLRDMGKALALIKPRYIIHEDGYIVMHPDCERDIKAVQDLYKKSLIK